MALTPVEIRHIRLRKAFFGYHAKQTDDLLADVVTSFEDVWRDRADVADKVEQLEGELVRYRELEEEIGCRPEKPLRKLFKIEAREETGQEFVWVYRAESEGPFTLQAEELAGGGWFTVAEIDRWLVERPQEIAPAFLFIWPRARKLMAS